MSKIFVHNTLSGKKEEFVPLSPNVVKMYVCGITPYDECHLGHARCYVVFDVIRRYFEYKGYQVKYVQNFTDIDDKIINKSNELKINTNEIAEKYIKEYFKYCKKLNIKPADQYPRVTQRISEIIKVVKTLIDKEFAYVVNGDVYYSVRKFKGYGKLSKRNIDDLQVGARVEPGENKKDPLDFALWKKSKPEEPNWESPWGKGRPGWHIECSVMSLLELCTTTLDVHGGGQDLIFPHHENEIAQSEAFTGKPFSKYWIHNGFVTINREKMSKSLGNFFSLKDIFSKYDPMVVRFFLLSQHYRSPLDFSDDRVDQSKKAYMRIVNCLSRTDEKEGDIKSEINDEIKMIEESFHNAMCDDFNTELALSKIFEFVRLANKVSGAEYKVIKEKICNLSQDILGINFPVKRFSLEDFDNKEIKKLVEKRELARENKNWQEADNIRKKIEELGCFIEDTPSGARVKPKE